jgi:hypothetical protein
MSKKLFLVPLFALLFCIPAFSLDSKALKKLVISHTTALGDSWEIKDAKLTYQQVSGTTGETDNPVSGNVAPAYNTLTFDLKDKDLQALWNVFNANKWSKLKMAYGVKEGERNYPESIRLKDAKGDKTVIFRSAPGADKTLPKEFRSIAAALDKIVVKYVPKPKP